MVYVQHASIPASTTILYVVVLLQCTVSNTYIRCSYTYYVYITVVQTQTASDTGISSSLTYQFANSPVLSVMKTSVVSWEIVTLLGLADVILMVNDSLSSPEVSSSMILPVKFTSNVPGGIVSDEGIDEAS